MPPTSPALPPLAALPPSSPASSRYVIRVPRLLFAVAWGTNHFVPLLLVYRATLDLSSVELAVLFGVYAVGLVPGLLLGGPLSDAVGRRSVVLPAAVVALAGTGILAWGAAGFPVLLAGRFVVGLGAGATFSAGTAWVQDLAVGSPEGTGARRAAIALSSGFGGGPLVTGLLAQWLPWPMRLPYLVHGIVLIACVLAVAAIPARADAAQPSPLAASRPAGADAKAPRRALTLPAGFGEIAIVAPWVFVFPSVSHAVLPALVRARLGSFAVVFAGVVTATTLFASVLVQPWLRPWRPRQAGLFGLAAGAAGLLCGAATAAATWPPGVLVAAVMLGTGYGGCLIAGLRFIEANVPSASRGGVTGVFYTLTYTGFASPLVLAALSKSTGEVGALLWTSAAAIGTFAYLALAGRSGGTRQRQEERQASHANET